MSPFFVKFYFYETLDPVIVWLKAIGAKYGVLTYDTIMIEALPEGWEKIDAVWGPIAEIRDRDGTVMADYNPIDKTLELMD